MDQSTLFIFNYKRFFGFDSECTRLQCCSIIRRIWHLSKLPYRHANVLLLFYRVHLSRASVSRRGTDGILVQTSASERPYRRTIKGFHDT